MATATIRDHRSDTLMRLLDEELVFSPSFRRIYSNHLAMALVALHQLGAPSYVLQTVFDAHAAGGAEMRDDTELLDERRTEVAHDGIEATVQARASALVESPGTMLFHPLIRLGYALDTGHEGQVAAALLDWEQRRQALPLRDPAPGSRRLPDVAADLAAHPAGSRHHTFDLASVARRPEVQGALVGMALDQHTLDDVSSFAISAHLAADDFITLHLVTGARAVRTLAGWLDQDQAERLAAHAVPVMAVAYAAVGAPPLLREPQLEELRRSPLPSTDEIARRATEDRDPHVIKLANVALVEEERTSDALYRYAAARIVGLVPPVRQHIDQVGG